MAAGAAAASGEISERLENRIRELRVAGRYADAIAPADSLLALLEADPAAPPYRVADARIEAETVRLAASLSEEDRRELARADSMDEYATGLGDYQARLVVAERQLEIRRRILGDEHTDVAGSLEAVGQHSVWIDQAERAAACFKEALGIARAGLGEEHPWTAFVISQLGFANQRLGNYAEAESLYLRGDAIRRAAVGDRDPSTLFWQSRLGWLKLDMGEYQEAERILRETMIAQKEVLGDDNIGVSASMENLALALMWLQRYPESDAMYREIFDLWSRSGGEDSEPPPNVIHCYAALRAGRGDEVTAEQLYLRAMAAYERAWGPEHPRLGGTMLDRAGSLMRLGRFAEAEALCDEVLARWPDDGENVAVALASLSVIASSRGDGRAAMRQARDALAAQEALTGPEHPVTARLALNLVQLVFESGDMVAAEAMCREVLARLDAVYGPHHTSVARARQILSGVYLQRGDFERAEAEATAALEVNRRIYVDEHLAVAAAVGRLAMVFEREDDYTRASQLGEEALAIAVRTSGGNRSVVARYLSALARARISQKDYALAEPLVREALAIRSEVLGEDNAVYAASLSQLSSCLSARGDIDGAIAALDRALAVEREASGAFDPGLAASLRELGALHYLRGEYEQAEVYLAEAADVYDLARVKIGSGMERAAFARSSPYKALALAQLERGEGDEAWLSVERTSGRALADLLADAERSDLSSAEVAREDSLRSLIIGLERRVEAYEKSAAIDSTAVTADDIEEAARDLAAAETAWSVFRHEMAELHPETEGRVVDLEGIQSALDPETALVGWLDVELNDKQMEPWVYVVRNRGSVIWVRLGTGGAGAPAKASGGPRTRNALKDPFSSLSGIRRDARSLWDERFAPVADALEGARNLVVVPSGPLLGVPVEALVLGDGRFVGEAYEVSYTPSATVYARLGGGELVQAGDERSLLVGDPPFTDAQVAEMNSESGSPWDLLAMVDAPDADASLLRSAAAGNRDALSSLPRLRGARAEVALLGDVVAEADVLLGPDASEQKLMSLADDGVLRGYRTLHIATHGLVDDQHPEQSALVLSQVGLPPALGPAMAGERVYDGLLTAREIVAECELDADLVTLSACETGLGREMVGEGYVGFAQAFLQAGARSLVVSLWKVDDRATALLMRRFYENRSGHFTGERSGHVAEPFSKAEALAEAKAWLRMYEEEPGRRPYEHPYYWSAFILIGDRS